MAYPPKSRLVIFVLIGGFDDTSCPQAHFITGFLGRSHLNLPRMDSLESLQRIVVTANSPVRILQGLANLNLAILTVYLHSF